MAAWIRYALLVGVILMSGLLVWLVRSPAPITPTSDITEAAEPPGDSPPLRRTLELNFDVNGKMTRSVRDYLKMMDIKSRVGKPSSSEWHPYAEAVPVIMADAERLWQSYADRATNDPGVLPRISHMT